VRDEPPQLHDQKILTGDLRLDLEYGFAAGWSFAATFGVRTLRNRIQYTDLDGNPLQLDYENTHHRNETLVGATDPWFMVRRGYNVESLNLALSFRAGVTFPVGNTEPDPFLLGDMGLPHQHAQFGTGTFNPILGAELRKEFRAPFNGSIGAYGLGILAPYSNDHGYRAGHRFIVGGELAGKLGLSGPILRGGLMLAAETPEKWASTPNPSEGNLGRTDLLVDVGVIYRVAKDWNASFILRVPISTEALNQVSYPAIGELGASALLHTHAGED
jgi:hypothetical protein